MNWYIGVLKKYAVFNGRAGRKEYWMYTLISLLVSVGLIILDNILGTTFDREGLGFLLSIYILATFVPNLAVSVRRMHDIGKSGWMILVSLVPIIGGIWFLVLLCSAGTAGDNRFGPNPVSKV